MDYFVRRAKERVLLFSSGEQLNLLFSSYVIFMDGTSNTAPSNFDQVFWIHIQNFNQGKRFLSSYKSYKLYSFYGRFTNGVFFIT